MIAPSIPKYTATLSSKAGLVEETLAALRLVSDGKSEDDLRFAFLQEDLLGKDTHENRLTIWKRLHQRFFVNWKRTVTLAKMVNWVSNFNYARLFIYYDFCISEPILFDAVTKPVFNRFSNGFSGIEISDLQAWLDSIQIEHPEVSEWSPQTRKKILSNVLTVLRDFGLMSGVSRKKFERVFMPTSLAGYILYSLKDRLDQFGPFAVIDASDWQLFWLDQSDVLNLLKELTREGYCIFQKQGEIMTLNLKWQSLEAYVEAVTGKI